MCLKRGEKMSMSEVKAIIDEVDENKDGKLDYSEVSVIIWDSSLKSFLTPQADPN